MARGSGRWGTKALRGRMPLPAERPTAPRFDGRYVGPRGSHFVAFCSDGSGVIDGVPATWSLTADVLSVASTAWDCEGALGHDSIFLLASPFGDHRRRVEWELAFERESIASEPITNVQEAARYFERRDYSLSYSRSSAGPSGGLTLANIQSSSGGVSLRGWGVGESELQAAVAAVERWRYTQGDRDD